MPQAQDPAGLADFLSSLAHDLRSPLGVVSETLCELRTDFDGQLTDDHRVLLGLAERSLRRLNRIADGMSLMVALDSGSFQLERGPVDLVPLLRAAADTAVGIEPRREVELVRDLPEAPCLLEADQDRLARAISEVVINAIRHARRTVRVHLELAAGEARLAVEDDGQGVPPARRDTLYQRLAPRSSRSGLGIGLSLAHDVIVAHGGKIILEASTLPPARPGTIGARFVITLPRGRGG
jgi:two-component system, OmpR family, sensor kinase